MHAHYRKCGGRVDYAKYRSVLKRFNLLVGDALLEGYSFPMGANLSRLAIIRVRRSFRHRRSVNWKESHKLREEILARGGTPKRQGEEGGEDWLVYYDDDEYVRFYWEKSASTVPNQLYYRFEPSRGKVGLKTRLKEHLKSHELAYLDFPLARKSGVSVGHR